MKFFKKLDARGFAHHFILVAVVLVVAVGGTYYLVASHADNCSPVSGASDPTSEPTSSPGCTPGSSPTTSPTETVVSCTINGVSAAPAYRTALAPTVTITNTGTATLSGATVNQLFSLGNSTVMGKGGGDTIALPAIAPNTSYTANLVPYTIPYASSTVSMGAYQVTSTSPPFICVANFTLPIKPIQSVTISPSDWKILYRSAITTDKPAGNVVELGTAASNNNGVVLGYVDTTPQGGTGLAKLNAFVTADYNQPAQLCVNARAAKSSKLLVTVLGVAGQTATYQPSLKTTYTTICYSVTIGNFKVTNAELQVKQETVGVPVYLNTITLTLGVPPSS